MKAIFYIIFTFSSCFAFSQAKQTVVKKTTAHKSVNSRAYTTAADGSLSSRSTTDTLSSPVKVRQSITEQRLRGERTPASPGASSGNSGTTTSAKPFVGGIYPKANADKTFDTSGANVNNTMNVIFTNATGNSTDTVGNINTINQGPVTTNSGAVDRSGQAQFGQTNWGEGRSVVGESQWTVPPPVTVAFNKEFPSITNANWTRNNLDSTIYSAKYRSGTYWITANYNAIGERLETITEIPYNEAPLAIKNLYSTRFKGIDILTINRVQVAGKRDMYQLKTRNGRTIYVTNEGAEIND